MRKYQKAVAGFQLKRSAVRLENAFAAADAVDEEISSHCRAIGMTRPAVLASAKQRI
jgi:ABC-type proline/glycine betaine transport system permease subunit